MLTHAAKSGLEALDWLRRASICDSGHADARNGWSNSSGRIRKQPDCERFSDVDLYGSASDSIQAAEVNFTAFLNKPIKQSQLYNV